MYSRGINVEIIKHIWDYKLDMAFKSTDEATMHYNIRYRY